MITTESLRHFSRGKPTIIRSLSHLKTFNWKTLPENVPYVLKKQKNLLTLFTLPSQELGNFSYPQNHTFLAPIT